MHFHYLFLSLALTSAVTSAPSTSNSTSSNSTSTSTSLSVSTAQSDIDAGRTLSQLAAVALQRSSQHFAGDCTEATVQRRQEWRTLSPAARRSFVAATKCLQKKPSLFPKGLVPGSFSVFEDFEAVHLNQTLFIHLSGTFLTWHRYYTHIYEQHLRDCGYQGNIPYWEWGLDVNDPDKSPLFDGSDTSLGANGDYVPHEGMILGQPGEGNGYVPLPAGTGGGCVTRGPFAGMQTHLGPVNLPIYGPPAGNVTKVADPMQNNPRCLRRDLCAGAAQQFTSFRNCTDLLLENDNIELFQAVLQGDPRYVHGSLGVHGGGHFTIGGDPGADAFASPGDPAFFLHHAQVDRMYWIWQNLDFASRQGVAGTHTFYNSPPSANVTVDDLLDPGVVGDGSISIRSVMNTVGGTPLCYQYV